MKKIVFLLSHIPNPRMLKRISALEKDFLITLVYWDRNNKNSESFEINSIIDVKKITINAPQGNPIKKIFPLVKFFYKSLLFLRMEKPDIIHTGNIDMLMITSFYRIFFKKEVKIIYEVADLPEYTFAKKCDSIKNCVFLIIQNIEKKMTRNISKIILTSPYFWKKYYSKFIESEKYLFIPNSPSKKLFGKYNKNENDVFTIGFIGSVRYLDQIKMLIEVVSELEENIDILVAGGGPGYNNLKKYTAGMSNVEMYGPYNYEKEILNLYQRIDLTYSVYDANLKNVRIALPNRLYESLVCQIPIVSASDTALGEFITLNEIGFTTRHDSKEELSDKLALLINDKKIIETYKNNCSKIKDQYYLEQNNQKLLKQYKLLV